MGEAGGKRLSVRARALYPSLSRTLARTTPIRMVCSTHAQRVCERQPFILDSTAP